MSDYKIQTSEFRKINIPVITFESVQVVSLLLCSFMTSCLEIGTILLLLSSQRLLRGRNPIVCVNILYTYTAYTEIVITPCSLNSPFALLQGLQYFRVVALSLKSYQNYNAMKDEAKQTSEMYLFLFRLFVLYVNILQTPVHNSSTTCNCDEKDN